jgi:hypothetical protein
MNQAHQRRLETLNFIQSMLLQLNQMASSERCDMLAYLIEMAYVESGDAIREARPHRLEIYKRHSAA